MIKELCIKAKLASIQMSKLSQGKKNNALYKMAEALEANSEQILKANKIDIEAAKSKDLKASLLDRLSLDQKKIQTMQTNSLLPQKIQSVPYATWTRLMV